MATGNTLIDNKPEPEGPTPAKAARRLRNAAGQVAVGVAGFLKLANQLVAHHTRAAIASELGDDAAKMLAFHAACKSFLAAQAPDVPAEDLPVDE